MEKNELTHLLKRCSVYDAMSVLREVKKEYINIGCDVEDLLLGAFSYKLLDGIVLVSWGEFDGFGYVYEQAYPLDEYRKCYGG